MSYEDRQYLAEQQRALVRAVLHQGEAPAGMQAAHVTRMAQTLLAKRSRAVSRSLPAVASALGDDFSACFANYASTTPLGSDEQDGDHFLRWLSCQPGISDGARLAVLEIRARRGFPVRLARLPASGALALAVRLPGFGLYVFHLKFSRWDFLRSKRASSD